MGGIEAAGDFAVIKRLIHAQTGPDGSGNKIKCTFCPGEPTAEKQGRGAHRRGLTWLDVIPDDGHVVVTVRSRVLVPEADDVAEFVHDDAELVAVLADGDGLGPVSATTHVGATPSRGRSRRRP